MANTSALRYKVEPWVRTQLHERYRQPFSSQVLDLVPGGRHEFDAVSADRSIVVSIKTNSGLTSGGNFPNGKVNAVTAELYYLTLVEAQTKVLLLTNPEFHEILLRHLKGAIALGVDIVLMELPAELQTEVDVVIAEASREMTVEQVAEATAVMAEAEAEAAPES
jgi:hypothetical protein